MKAFGEPVHQFHDLRSWQMSGLFNNLIKRHRHVTTKLIVPQPRLKSEQYKKYLANQMRVAFGYEGCPRHPDRQAPSQAHRAGPQIQATAEAAVNLATCLCTALPREAGESV
jgi:hypothetical protein